MLPCLYYISLLFCYFLRAFVTYFIKYCVTVLHSLPFLRARASIAIARISYGNFVCPSRSGTVPRPGEIETSGFHHMIA